MCSQTRSSLLTLLKHWEYSVYPSIIEHNANSILYCRPLESKFWFSIGWLGKLFIVPTEMYVRIGLGFWFYLKFLKNLNVLDSKNFLLFHMAFFCFPRKKEDCNNEKITYRDFCNYACFGVPRLRKSWFLRLLFKYIVTSKP